MNDRRILLKIQNFNVETISKKEKQNYFYLVFHKVSLQEKKGWEKRPSKIEEKNGAESTQLANRSSRATRFRMQDISRLTTWPIQGHRSSCAKTEVVCGRERCPPMSNIIVSQGHACLLHIHYSTQSRKSLVANSARCTVTA